MKRFYLATVAMGLAASVAAAQPAPPGQATGHDQSHDQPHEQPHPQMAAHPTHETMRPPMQVQNRQPARPPMGKAGHPMQVSHQWHSGDRFDGTRRPVGDWSHYHLRQPPAGYEWVQDGSQFVLIGIASGIIASVILNSAYQ